MKSLLWIFVSIAALAKGEERLNCDVFWKSSQPYVEIVAPLQLLKPMDSLFQITTVPFYSNFEPCAANKSYEMTLKDHVDEWLHLNPLNGQLQITESGLQMAHKGKSLGAEILITSPTSSLSDKVTLNLKFISHPICIDVSSADNLELMLQQNYEFDIQEDSASSLTLGTISSTFELLQRCKDPIKVVCRVTQGEEYVDVVDNTLTLIKPPDREVFGQFRSSKKAEITSELQCDFRREEGGQEVGSIKKKVSVFIVDTDDTAPFPHDESLAVTIKDKILPNGSTLKLPNIMLYDKDLPIANDYEVVVPPSINNHLSLSGGRPQKQAYQCKGDSSWCPCRHQNPQDCIFDGTLFFVQDVQIHAHKDLDLLKENLTFPIHFHDMKKQRDTETIYIKVNLTLVEEEKSVEVPQGDNFFNVSLPLTSSKYARVFDTKLFLGISEKLKIKEAKWPQNAGSSLRPLRVFELTPDQTILYLDNPSTMRKKVQRVESEEKSSRLQIVFQTETPGVRIILNVAFEGPSSRNCRGRSFNCAEYSIREECENSCGRKSGVFDTCQWIPEKTNNLTYSTCSSDSRTCPDEVCDSLERLNPAICPQDCMAKKNILMGNGFHMENNNRGLGFGKVKRPNMICTCQGQSCSCIHQKLSHSVIEEHESERGEISTTLMLHPDQPLCDVKCKWISSLVTLLTFVLALVLFLFRRRIRTSIKNLFDKKQKRPSGTLTDVVTYIPNSVNSMSSGSNLENRVVNASNFCRWDDHHFKAANRLSQTGSVVTESTTASRSNVRELEFLRPSGSLSYDKGYDTPKVHLESCAFHQVEKKWEFPRCNLIWEKTIGEGEFGKVMSAKAIDRSLTKGHKRVAVKMVKTNGSREEIHDLLAEFNVLKDLQHPNVIGVMGVCTSSGGPVCIIMEHAEHGSLRDYLRKSRGIFKSTEGHDTSYQSKVEFLQPSDILSFAWQIAKGMEYLSTTKLVHRDLAARNVLVCDKLICKISDFGLTRDVYLDDTYWKKSNGRIPVKWLSPESLRDHLYTTKSDVWSYGILLWELVTLGSSPYPGIQPEKLLNILTMGYRMQKPANCSDELYSLMSQSWMYDPDDRPNFADLVTKTHTMLKNSGEYLEVSPNLVDNITYLEPIFPESYKESDEEIDETSDEQPCENAPNVTIVKDVTPIQINEDIETSYLMSPQTD